MEFKVGDYVKLISGANDGPDYYHPPVGFVGRIIGILDDDLVEIEWPPDSTVAGRFGKGDTWYTRADSIWHANPDEIISKGEFFKWCLLNGPDVAEASNQGDYDLLDGLWESFLMAFGLDVNGCRQW